MLQLVCCGIRYVDIRGERIWIGCHPRLDHHIGAVHAGSNRSQHVVVERRPVDGRVVSVLDPHRLVARAEEIIERAVA